MKSSWTIGKKLITAFIAVAAITLLLGIVGYYGAVKSGDAINEIGAVRLPSVQSLLVMSEAQTAVDSAENALLSRGIDLAARDAKYATFADAWKRAEEAWKVYEPLPQTAEEEVTWKQFVPAWEAWKKDHLIYVSLSKEYDKTVADQQKGDELYEKMAGQSLKVNPVSFGKAEALLNRIVEIYRSKADNAQASYSRVDLLTVHSLLTISEAQTAIDSSENALLDRSSDLTMRKEAYDRIMDAWKRVDVAWKIYEPLEQTPEEKILWNEFVPAWNAWKRDHETFVGLSKTYDATVNAILQSNAIYQKMTHQALVTNGVTFSAAEELLNKLVDINTIVAKETVQVSMAAGAWMKTMMLFSMIIGVAGALLLGVFISRSINNALKQVIDGLNEGAEQVSSASGQVSSASQSLAEGASEQAASIEESSSSLEEMSSMTKQNADNANQANTLMTESRKVVGTANESMAQLTESMKEISKASEETSKIIKTIDEIAFQTNLLALNAAVEAARAGEAGAGFAVVADEVRNLAMRASEAAKNTANLIEGTVKKVKDGSEIVDRTNDAFQQVAASSTKVGQLVSEIAASSSEQAQGIEQINKAVTEMDKVTQQNAANAEESASASEEMNAQAEQMKGMVDELVAMVGGASGNRKSYAPPLKVKRLQPGKGKAGQSHHALMLHHAPVKQASTTQRRDPEAVIPMEDDFKDF